MSSQVPHSWDAGWQEIRTRHRKEPELSEFHFIELLRAAVVRTAIQGVGIRQRTWGSLCTPFEVSDRFSGYL